MGATLRQSDPEFDQPSNTEQLFNWITTVRTKKIKYLRSRRRNIRVEAVLGYALSQAEQELRNKQIARINRWQELKKQMKKNNASSGNNNNSNNENKNNSSLGCIVMDNQACADDGSNAWAGNLYPELNSLDTFMSKLSEVKAPLQR